MTTPHDTQRVLNTVRQRPGAAAAVVLSARDLVRHWRRRPESAALTDVAYHMTTLVTLIAQVAIAIDAMESLPGAGDADDDSAEFAVEQDLGKLKLP